MREPGRRIVVAGSGVAGVHAVRQLRRRGFDGRVTMLAAEDEPPYDRPPLSKELLTGDLDEDDIRLMTDEELAGIDLVPAAARSLDPARRRIGTTAGEFAYDGLILATGAEPIRPRDWSLPGVHTLRTLADARAIKADLARGRPRVVVVGGGFIGCEIAAAARGHGLHTTVVEAQPAPLRRVLAPVLADRVVALHREHGVRFRCGSAVRGLRGTRRVEAVELDDGTVLDADLVVVGIGARPVTSWLAGSGVDGPDGVAADETLATALPGVYAAGDVARWRHPRTGPTRVEHWTNAKAQGMRAADNLLDPASARPYDDVPYVWSDQHGRKLQVAGAAHAAEVRFLQTDATGFLAVLVDDDTVVGAAGLDRGREFGRLRRAVGGPLPDLAWQPMPV